MNRALPEGTDLREIEGSGRLQSSIRREAAEYRLGYRHTVPADNPPLQAWEIAAIERARAEHRAELERIEAQFIKQLAR